MCCRHPWVNESDTDADTDTPQNRGSGAQQDQKHVPRPLLMEGEGLRTRRRQGLHA